MLVQPQHASFVGTLQPEDWAYLQQLPFSLTLQGHGLVVTHAGLVPGIPLQDQQLHNLVDVSPQAPASNHDCQMQRGFDLSPLSQQTCLVPWPLFIHLPRSKQTTCSDKYGVRPFRLLRVCVVQMRHVEQIDATDKTKGWKTVPKFPRDAGIPWGQAYEGESGHVVYGHHARRRLQVRHA